MIADVLTVMWKEWKELYAQYRKADLNLLVSVLAMVVLGAFPALQARERWMSSPMVLIFSGWVPLILVSSVIADAFAGERERQTLEPLLASHLSDTSILIGKIASAVSYGWGHALFMLLIGLITANVMDVGGGFLFYSPSILIAGILLSFLGSGAAACAGVIVSLRAPTVKYAQQVLSSASMLVFVLLFIAARTAPIDWWGISSKELVSNLIIYSTLILALLDLALFLIAKSRFRREKLILD